MSHFQTLNKYVCLCVVLFVAANAHAQTAANTPLLLKDSQILVRNSEMSDLSLDEIGTLSHKNGGLTKDIWQDISVEYAEKLLILLDKPTPDGWISDLKKKILLTSALPPKHPPQQKTGLFIIRLKQLAKLGAYEEVYAMVEQVPVAMRSEEMVKIIVAARLIAGELELAYSAINANMTRYPSLEWREWLVLCQAAKGNKAAANLTLKLMNEEEIELSDGFQQHVEQFLNNEDDGQLALQQWKNVLKASILAMPDIAPYTPSQKFLDGNLLFNAKLASWWAGVDDKESSYIRSRLLLRNYSMLHGIGDKIGDNDWLDLGLYVLEHTDEGAGVNRDESLTVMFETLTEQKLKAAVIIFAVALLSDEKAISALPTSLLHQLLRSLTVFGLKDEAMELAREALQ